MPGLHVVERQGNKFVSHNPLSMCMFGLVYFSPQIAIHKIICGQSWRFYTCWRSHVNTLVTSPFKFYWHKRGAYPHLFSVYLMWFYFSPNLIYQCMVSWNSHGCVELSVMAMTMAVMTPEFNNCDEVVMMTSGWCLTCSVPRHTLPGSNMNAQTSQMRHFS